MTEWVPSWTARCKQRLKPWYLEAQRVVARTLRAYSPSDLAEAVRAVGIRGGDAVLVHSGFRRTSGFTGTPADVIACLERAVGDDGHLLMMSIPYRGASQRYAAQDPIFDVRRTPSAVGVISEIFRRRPDVRRSLSPLHPVLASGPLAGWLTLDHDKVPYSCGRGTPFERFLQMDGTFLFVDAPYGALTFMHYAEDQLRQRLPCALYEADPLAIRVVDAGGRACTVRQFVFSAEARARRNFSTVERAIRASGGLRHTTVGNSTLLAVRARDVIQCANRLVEEGPGFYC